MTGCCLYEDCNKDPCKDFGKETVCSKMASCQEDKCNFDYDSAKASQPPTLPSEANSVTTGKVLGATLVLAVSFSLFIKVFKTFLWQVSLRDKLAAFDLLHGVLKNCMKYVQTLIS